MTTPGTGHALVHELRLSKPNVRHIALACLGLTLMRLVVRVLAARLGYPSQVIVVVPLVTAFWFPTAIAIGYFYAWLVGRGIDRRGQLALHLLAAVVVSIGEAVWSQWVVRLTGGVPTRMTQWAFLRLDWNALLYVLAVTGFAAARALRIARARERMATELDAALTDAQLHGLALQLQPHFLFNTLLLIAEAAYTNAGIARQTLGALQTLLRTAYAYGGRRFVTVAEETAFLEAYAAIQTHRFGDRLQVVFSLAPDVQRATLPPLLLQPLVENAIRHGISPRGRGGCVRLAVWKTPTTLEVAVEDDGQGLSSVGAPHEGTGLSLTRRRLAGLYGDAAHLRVSARDGGGVEARVTVPYSEDTHDARALSWQPSDDEEEDHEDWGNTGDFSVVLPETADDTGDAPNADDRVDSSSMTVRLAVGWSVALASIIEMHWLGLRLGYFKSGSMTWYSLFADTIASLPFWLVLTVGAVAISRRLEALGLRTRSTIPLHAVAAISIATAHALLGARVEQALWWGAPPAGGWSSYYEWAPWDVLSYALVVMIARLDDLTLWARRRVVQTRALRVQVAAAARRLARLRVQQPLLISALEGVANADGALAIDQASVRFADLVRLLLSSAESESHSLRAEILLTEYYAALRTRARGTFTLSRATSEAAIPPAIVATVLHALLTQVDDPTEYAIRAEPVGDTLAISMVVMSDMPLPDRSAAGDKLQRWIHRQLGAACDASARLTFIERDGGAEALLQFPFVPGELTDDDPQCDYSPDDHFCLAVNHAVARVRSQVGHA